MSHPVVELARPEMAALAELASECVGSAVVGDEIIILAVEGGVSAVTRELRVGQRLPLIPPYGPVFLAWSSRDRVDQWLSRVPAEGDGLRPALERTLAVVRDRGYAVVLENDQVAAVQALADQSAREPWNEELRDRLRAAIPEQADEYSIDEIDEKEEYAVSIIAAPVFGVDSSVVYALTLQGFTRLSGSEVIAIGNRLAMTCRVLTRSLGGRMPVPVEAASK